jgi:hypothetical protein
MKRGLVIAFVIGVGTVAVAAPPPEPAPPTPTQHEDSRGRRHLLAPIPYVWRSYDMERQNVGAQGRKNAVGDASWEAMTPSLQRPPLVNY